MTLDHLYNYSIRVIIIALFYFPSIFAQEKIDLNCFTVVVGKDVSADGSTIVAHNEDDSGEQIVNLYKVPSQKHSNDEVVNFNRQGEIDQVSKTNGFLWLELPGMKVADSFINDYGLVVTSNGCPSREENPDTTESSILYWLRKLVAERANTSKEAVRIAASLIDKYGYASSGRTYTFADKNEAWIFSAIFGKHWIAQRVPDDKVVVIPNYYTIGEINLDDTTNFLGSPDIITYAIKNDWYNPEEGKEFNFAKAYTSLSSINHPGNINRIWRGINLLSRDNYAIDKDLPFSFTPYKELDIQDVMHVLSDHYEGCELDKSDMYKNGDPHKENYATICSPSTQYSFVVQLRKNMPVEIGTLVWLAYYRPGVNLYTPLYLGLKEIPQGFANTDYQSATELHLNPLKSTFDTVDSHAYWNYVSAVNKVEENFFQNYPKVNLQNDYLQNRIIRETVRFERELLKTYKKNPHKAIEML
ncbi:MAG: C69 family dipeptidase, partial [Bacteroidota bacterium]